MAQRTDLLSTHRLEFFASSAGDHDQLRSALGDFRQLPAEAFLAKHDV